MTDTETTERAAQRNLIETTFQSIFHCPFLVTYDDDAEIIECSSYDGSIVYIMSITSDDDEYVFSSFDDSNLVVRIPFPN